MIFRFLGQTRRELFLYCIFSFDGHNGIVNVVERAKPVLVFVFASDGWDLYRNILLRLLNISSTMKLSFTLVQV